MEEVTIKKGQKITLSCVGLDKEITGTVEFVGELAERFDIRVRFENQNRTGYIMVKKEK